MGTPRTVMLALPSPPEDSERTPGTERSTSAALVGTAWAIASASSVLRDTLDFSFDVAPAVPVTTMRFICKASLSGAACVGVSWASAPLMCSRASDTAAPMRVQGKVMGLLRFYRLRRHGDGGHTDRCVTAPAWRNYHHIPSLMQSIAIR